MKTLTLLLLIACSGCAQLIVDRPDGSRLKINTLFMSTGLNGLYHDTDFTQFEGVTGITDNIEVQYNPYTGVKIKTTK